MEEVEVYVLVCLSIWNNRNVVTYGGPVIPVELALDNILVFLARFPRIMEKRTQCGKQASPQVEATMSTFYQNKY